MIIGLMGPAGAGKDLGAERFIKEHGFVRVAFADPLKRYAQDIYAFTDEQLWGPSEMRNKPDERYPREHTWKEVEEVNPDFKELACACCGQKTNKRQVEDDVWVPDTDEITQCFLTCRYALQLLGTEYGRHCYPDTWVDYAMRIANRLKSGSCYYDMRTGLRHTTMVDGAAMTAKTDVVISDVRFINEIRGIHRGGGYVIRIVPPKKTSTESWRKHVSESEQEGIPDSEFDGIIQNQKAGVEPFWVDVDKAYLAVAHKAICEVGKL